MTPRSGDRIRGWLCAWILTLPALALAQTPIEVAAPVSGEIVDAAQVDEYRFSVTPGARVHVQRNESSNYAKLNWRLLDSAGREIAANYSEITALGPVVAMGGEYAL